MLFIVILEKTAGTDVALETALMSEMEKKSCGMSGGGMNPRDSNYLATPVRVSLGHQEDISPYATFRLPAPGMEPTTGPGPGPDLPPTQHNTQHCDKLQLATSVSILFINNVIKIVIRLC